MYTRELNMKLRQELEELSELSKVLVAGAKYIRNVIEPEFVSIQPGECDFDIVLTTHLLLCEKLHSKIIELTMTTATSLDDVLDASLDELDLD
jgi:hypothetical protein